MKGRRDVVYFKTKECGENKCVPFSIVEPMLDHVESWAELLASGEPEEFDAMRIHERTGRPLGMEGFVEKISCLIGRDLSKKKPGPKQSEN